MLTNSTNLKGLAIHATDCEIGTVKQFYFDDEAWAIRYLVVETGGWLAGRQVLISPLSIIRMNGQARRVDVSLTKKEVENSPNIDTQRPISRQHETEYLDYFSYPAYWRGPYLWGPMSFPLGYVVPPTAASRKRLADIKTESMGSHLRSSEEVTGYHIEASDGEIGHAVGFILDDETWALRYVEVSTRNWWPGKKVLVSPSWIRKVSWMESEIYVDLSREAIKSGPEYFESAPITSEYEDRLHSHYGLAPYWHMSENKPSLPKTGT